MVLIHERLQQAYSLRASRIERNAPRPRRTPRRSDLSLRENVLLAYLKADVFAATCVLVARWVIHIEKPVRIIYFDDELVKELFAEYAVHVSFSLSLRAPVRGNIMTLFIYHKLIDARLYG